MESDEFWRAMDAYNDVFGEFFPTEMAGCSEADMIGLMRDAVASGVPFDPKLPEGCIA
ncbi:hypothetical protein [Adlercreutzia equolifaciens]|jgi:hypothetical protein|uniref:hypothetical protein n=1 Tax=Adlercreutzia equolifaciens TaxID=446660 RepID=UPI002047EF5D|nr:hypothetical protein [Adlercreutzia equolifaciens]DAV03677.1 MAG TPA: hypothetical protein [Caudoviricetes sp.]